MVAVTLIVGLVAAAPPADIWAEDTANAKCPAGNSDAFCKGYTSTYRPADRTSQLFLMAYKGRSRGSADLLNAYVSFSSASDDAIATVHVFKPCAWSFMCPSNEDRRRGSAAALRVKVELVEKVLATGPRLDQEDRAFYLQQAGMLAAQAASLNREATSPEEHDVADTITRLQVQLAAISASR